MTPAQSRIAEAKAARADLPLGGEGFLRPLRVGEVVDAYVDGLNDPVVRRFVVAARRQRQTRETVEAFVAANHAAADALLFGIFLDGRLRGTLRLHDVDRVRGEAWLGIAVFDTSVWGLGLGRRAITAAADFAFNDLGLDHINAGIEVENIGSRKAFAAAGFARSTRELPGDDPSIDHWVRRRQRESGTSTA